MLTKKSMFRKVMLAALFAVITCSCSPITTPGDNANPVPTSLSRQTPTSVMDNSPLQYNCLQLVSIQSFPNMKGTIATFDEVTNNNISLWFLDKGEELILGRAELLNAAFSTDRKIAYIDADRQEVVILSAYGEELTALPASKNWIEILDWADEEKLLISNMPFRNDGSWYPPSSTIILDVASGKYQEVFPNYPGIYPYTSGPPNFGRYSFSITAYDRTLSRVVYPGVTLTDYFIALWDVPNHREVARIQLPSSHFPSQWKSDGSSFIISAPPSYTDSKGNIYNIITGQEPYVGGNELFGITKNGDVHRLSYLTTKYIAEESAYAWSPSGNLVAFWLKIDNDNLGWQLAVLNTETGKITAYCVSGGDGSLPIIWSPDEKQIISTIRNIDNNKLESILININENTAFVIQKSKIVFGWMKE